MRNPDWPMMRIIMRKPLRVWDGMLITMIRELKWETHIGRDEDDYEQTVKIECGMLITMIGEGWLVN